MVWLRVPWTAVSRHAGPLPLTSGCALAEIPGCNPEYSLRTYLLANLTTARYLTNSVQPRSEMKDQDTLLDLQTTDSFRLYLDEVGRHPLLTKDDEIELSQAFEAGQAAQTVLRDLPAGHPDRQGLEAEAARGERARRKMIESNLRLVVSIARRFSATGLPLGDLVQEGNLGLLRAVEKFDWRKGFKFSTYATWWIRQAIARGAADRGARAIRLPVHVD